ncbi:MAG: LysR family transcriptional regulator [Nocardioidaceae bacterium]|nr:LysR family transcriptional regulator [Nocardioidaceae bacterium]MCL2614395.1 LysR family transcriptional regulator [Nocardioidaceae bacterium]
MIDLRRLEALVALHRAGTVSAAAERLHYGQPTVSHHLRRLETETGSVLLQRVGRGVRLTPEGERLARRGEEILGLLERAEAELAASTSLQSGRVRVAAFPSAAATLVPAAVGILAERHPGIDLELAEAEPPEAAEMLRAGTADLALTFRYPDQADPDGLTSTTVLTDPLYLVTTDAVGREHRRPSGEPHLADYAESRWITGCERCRSQLMTLCEAAGFTPRIAFASDDYVAVQSLVASGLGVTLLPGLALQAHQRDDVRRSLVRGGERRVQVSSYGAPPRPAVVDAVAGALADAARPQG